jgi:hypothetical protein
MAAIAPYIINRASGLSPDTQLGLNADLTGLLLDSFQTKPERTEIEHNNFAGVPVMHISGTPKFSIDIKAKVLARSATFATAHPGNAFARSTIAQLRTGIFNGFPEDSGFLVAGNYTRDQPRGDCDDISFPLRFFGFATDSTGTLNALPSGA